MGTGPFPCQEKGPGLSAPRSKQHPGQETRTLGFWSGHCPCLTRCLWTVLAPLLSQSPPPPREREWGDGAISQVTAGCLRLLHQRLSKGTGGRKKGQRLPHIPLESSLFCCRAAAATHVLLQLRRPAWVARRDSPFSGCHSRHTTRLWALAPPKGPACAWQALFWPCTLERASLWVRWGQKLCVCACVRESSWLQTSKGFSFFFF